MSDTLSVEVWRGAETGALPGLHSAAPARTRPILDVVTEIQRDQDPTLVLSLRLPRRHVRLLRHGGERPAALDLPHARVARSSGARRRAAARAAAQFHHRQGPGRRDDRASSTSGATRTGYFEPGRQAGGGLRRRCRRRRRAPRRRRRRSSASAAACATPPATWSPGTGLSRAGRAQPRLDAGQRRARPRRAQARLAAVGGDFGCQCLPHPHELHHVLPQGIAPTYAIAGLKRAMVWRALKGGRAVSAGAVPRPAAERRRARARRGGASRHHRLCRARRVDGGRDAGAHPRQLAGSSRSIRCSSSRSRSTRRSGCATYRASGRRGAARSLDVALAIFAVLLLLLGMRAVLAVYRRMIRASHTQPGFWRRCCTGCPASRSRFSCRCTSSRSARRSTAPLRSTRSSR